jgi:hypothetical protein
MEEINLKRKVTLKRKGDSESPISPPRKSKWWLWLLLAIFVIVGGFLIVKNLTPNSTDKSLITKTEQATTKANEIIAEVQSGNVNYEDAKAEVAEAQKTVDQAKVNAKTDEEKQAVADAQANVDKADKTVEASKQATLPSETDKTSPEQGEEVAATTPVETSKPDNATNQKPVSTTTQGNQSSSKKPSKNASSQSTLAEGTLEQKAKEVIRGNYGNGADRKIALGSEYNAIQSKVNEMYRNGETR